MSEVLRRKCADLPAPTVEEVAEGVFAYVQLDGSWGLNNAGILCGMDWAGPLGMSGALSRRVNVPL